MTWYRSSTDIKAVLADNMRHEQAAQKVEANFTKSCKTEYFKLWLCKQLRIRPENIEQIRPTFLDCSSGWASFLVYALHRRKVKDFRCSVRFAANGRPLEFERA